MNPKPAALAPIVTLLRMLVILAASTFFGALVLPLAADGTLPSTWAAWRHTLAVAGSATIVAEIAWGRTHLAALAQASGLLPAPSSSSALSKGAQAGYSTLHALLATVAASAVVLLALAAQYRLAAVMVLALVGLLALPPRAVRWLSIALACVTLTGCSAFWSGTSAVLDCGSKVAEDAAQNMSVAQVVADLPAQCGMDAAAVMALLLHSVDAKVQKSAAYAEASRAREMLVPPGLATCGGK